jgi:O-acetyl-ADP-ribose deacetylase
MEGNTLVSCRVLGVHLVVHKEDFGRITTEAIICPSDPGLTNSSGLSRAIAEAAGRDYADQCRRMASNQRGVVVPDKPVLIFAAALKNTKHVIHANVPPRAGRDSDCLMKKVVSKSLDLAAENSIKSVAFTLMGTGSLGWQDSDSAQAVVQGVYEWLNTNRLGRGIEKICFFDRDASKAHAFVTVVQRLPGLTGDDARHHGGAAPAGPPRHAGAVAGEVGATVPQPAAVQIARACAVSHAPCALSRSTRSCPASNGAPASLDMT